MVLKKSKVFISHSSHDKKFASMLVEELKTDETEPWIDHEQIYAGDDVLDKIGEGLSTMDIFVLLISRTALSSLWVDLETKAAQIKEIRERRSIILAYRLDDISLDEIPWFLQMKHVPVINRNIEGVKEIFSRIEMKIKTRIDSQTQVKEEVHRDARIDSIIKDIKLGDWDKAEIAALNIMEYTNENGHNELFDSLISYLYSNDLDQRFILGMIIECFSNLAPWLFNRPLLFKLGTHPDFGVRSSIAMICYNYAQWVPVLVPVDLALKLSHHEEDYYVDMPAKAALKYLCRDRTIILREFYNRLNEEDKWAREHAAEFIYEISLKEPEILDEQILTERINSLDQKTDKEAIGYLKKTIKNIKKSNYIEIKYPPF